MSEKLPKGIATGIAPMANATQKPIDHPLKDQIGDRQTAEEDWHRIAEIGLRFSDNLILRAGPISQWLWGEWNPRKAYYLAEKTNAYPFFTENAQLAIRKSTVLAHIWAKESRAFSDEKEEQWVKLAILLANLLRFVRHAKGSSNFGETNVVHLWTALLQETLTAIERVLASE
jgi:hypothetical protein